MVGARGRKLVGAAIWLEEDILASFGLVIVDVVW